MNDSSCVGGAYRERAEYPVVAGLHSGGPHRARADGTAQAASPHPAAQQGLPTSVPASTDRGVAPQLIGNPHVVGEAGGSAADASSSTRRPTSCRRSSFSAGTSRRWRPGASGCSWLPPTSPSSTSSYHATARSSWVRAPPARHSLTSGGSASVDAGCGRSTGPKRSGPTRRPNGPTDPRRLTCGRRRYP